MVQLQSNSEASNIDSGQYTLKIGSSELAQVPDFNNPDVQVDKVRIYFTIAGDSEWNGTEFSDLFSLTTGKQSKLGQLARAAFKTDDLPKEWDTEDLEGKRVIATVKLKDNGYNVVVPDTIMPAKSGRPPVKPAPEGDDDVWSEDDAGAA
jgi:hypothetical protein